MSLIEQHTKEKNEWVMLRTGDAEMISKSSISIYKTKVPFYKNILIIMYNNAINYHVFSSNSGLKTAKALVDAL
ncbi:MAG TPA: hypothetical protein VF884_07690 [Nitrososphaeraceae archaeon]